MKFKPGVSANFANRYVQVSQRALRFFRSQYGSVGGKPLFTIRKKAIIAVKPIKIDAKNFLKKGSRAARSGTENCLFENAFEILLKNQKAAATQFNSTDSSLSLVNHGSVGVGQISERSLKGRKRSAQAAHRRS